MGFFGKKRNSNKSSSTSGSYDSGRNDSNDVALQGRMQDLQADMQRVRQRHEAEMRMLNKRMVSIVAKVHTATPPPSSSKAVPPPPPPGPPPGGLPPPRRRSRSRGTVGRDSSIHSSNISQHSSDNQSNSQRRRRSGQEQKVHTRHFYQLPQPIQSAPPVPEISIVAESVGSATASISSSRNHHYPGDDNSSHDTSQASQSSYSYKNGRKVRTVYRTVRAIHDGDRDRATVHHLAPTTTPQHKIHTSRSSSRSRQPGTFSSSSYDESRIVVRNHPPPQNLPVRSNIKPLRGRVHATDGLYDDIGSSSSPRSITDSPNNRRYGQYQTNRKNNDTAVKEEWTISRPVTENNTMLSERNSSRRNYHDRSTPEKDRPNRSSLSDRIRNNRKGNVLQPVDIYRDDAYNHKPRLAHTTPDDVYEATNHVQNGSSRPNRNQVTPMPVTVTRSPPTISEGPQIDLMASIRAGVQLKSVSDEKDSEPPHVPQESSVNVLMAAIQERKKRILAQEEEDEVDW